MEKDVKIFKFKSGWLFEQPEFMEAMKDKPKIDLDEYYLSEHDENVVYQALKNTSPKLSPNFET